MFSGRVEAVLCGLCLLWIIGFTFVRLVMPELATSALILALNLPFLWLAYGALTDTKKSVRVLISMSVLVVAIYLLWKGVPYPPRDYKPGVEDQMFIFILMSWIVFFSIGLIARRMRSWWKNPRSSISAHSTCSLR